MSDGNMTYENWLRGCVHHDGRHGYVTLPCDEVLKIADFIERLRADRKTENSSEKPNNCKAQTDYDKGLQLFADILFDKEKTEQFLKECEAMGIEPQTERRCE